MFRADHQGITYPNSDNANLPHAENFPLCLAHLNRTTKIPAKLSGQMQTNAPYSTRLYNDLSNSMPLISKHLLRHTSKTNKRKTHRSRIVRICSPPGPSLPAASTIIGMVVRAGSANSQVPVSLRQATLKNSRHLVESEMRMLSKTDEAA